MRLRICLLWAVVFLQACHADPEIPTYREPFLEDEQKVAGFFQTHLPENQLINLNSGWVFLGQDSLTGIHREWPEPISQPKPVALPHRLPLPNHSLWYRWEEMLEPGQMNQYLYQPEKPTYGRLQFGPLAILSLDPNINFPVSVPKGTRQREWLEEQLESDTWQNSRWKILVMHQPPYSQGWPGYQG